MATLHVDLAAAMRRPTGFRPFPFANMVRLTGETPTPVEVEETADDIFARGVAEGQQLAEISHVIERRALLDLLANAEAFHHESSNELADLIGEAVLRLVSQIVGDAPVDADWLRQKVEAAAAIVAQADQDRTLCLHPLDAALLGDFPMGFPMQADPSLPRGALRIATVSGWVEHGRPVYLDALRAALGEGSVAP